MPAGIGQSREMVAMAFWTAAVAAVLNWLAYVCDPLPIGTTRTRSAFARCSMVALIGVVEPVSVVNVMVPAVGVAVLLAFAE